MKGKETCKILKEIRQKIAEQNNIEFVTSECTHKGDCLGSCPKCEAEVRYLEGELDKKRRLGKSIAVMGIAASIALTGVGCADTDTLGGDMEVIEQTDGLLEAEPEEWEEPIIMGEMEAPEVPEDIQGDIVCPVIPEKPEDLEGQTVEELNALMTGMLIEDITVAWGDADMSQKSGDRGIIAYFTDARDIVIQYNIESGSVINVTTIEND